MRNLFLSLFICLSVTAYSQNAVKDVKIEIIYGRKDGMALTMFVQMPEQSSKKRAVIIVESGNWKSSYERAVRYLAETKVYTDKGYTIFTVIPGSQPRFAIPEQITDLKRAVRFIRYHAKDYNIDPDHIGISGFSSGGHLSLVIATANDKIDSSAVDAVDRVSSSVQAAAVFYPPTDFLNFGKQNIAPANMRTALILSGVYAAFDFKVWNDTLRSYVSVTDEMKKLQIAKEVSPIYAVTADDPPILIFHGDADRLVPLQQSETMIKKLEMAKVPNRLIIKKGAGHGWKEIGEEQKEIVIWFDKYLK